MRDLRVMLGLRDSFSYLPLLARVKEVAPSRQVVFTGHSMGGSIAAIVAALTHRPSVSFMPPGQYYSFVNMAVYLRGNRRQEILDGPYSIVSCRMLLVLSNECSVIEGSRRPAGE